MKAAGRLASSLPTPLFSRTAVYMPNPSNFPGALVLCCFSVNVEVTFISRGTMHHHHHHKHQGLDQFDPFRHQSYSCSRQRFFGLPIVLLRCGL